MTVRVKFHRGSRMEAENMISKAEGDTYGALLILNLLCVCACVSTDAQCLQGSAVRGAAMCHAMQRNTSYFFGCCMKPFPM